MRQMKEFGLIATVVPHFMSMAGERFGLDALREPILLLYSKENYRPCTRICGA